jgi:exopolysaccharide production protein ExoZ
MLNPGGRLDLIQVARGIAAMLVVMAHANLMAAPSFLDGFLVIGWCGVHFFFVLSGFIIFYAHANQLGDRSKLPEYVFKRFRRIFPIYWIYTIGVVMLDHGIRQATGKALISWLGSDPGAIWKSLVLWPTNMLANEMPVLPVAWTLTYELVFYAFFCVFLLFNWSIGLVLATVWAVLILATSIGYFDSTNTAFRILLSPLNFEFFLGCIAGYIATGVRLHPKTGMAYITLFIGLIMLATSWWNAFLKYEFFPQNDVLQFGVPFFIIILSIVFLDALRPRGGASGFLRFGVFLGEASYSIYLVHFPVIVAVGFILRKIPLSHPTLAFISSVALSVLAAAVLYNYVERPLLQLLARTKRK